MFAPGNTVVVERYVLSSMIKTSACAMFNAACIKMILVAIKTYQVIPVLPHITTLIERGITSTNKIDWLTRTPLVSVGVTPQCQHIEDIPSTRRLSPKTQGGTTTRCNEVCPTNRSITTRYTVWQRINKTSTSWRRIVQATPVDENRQRTHHSVRWDISKTEPSPLNATKWHQNSTKRTQRHDERNQSRVYRRSGRLSSRNRI